MKYEITFQDEVSAQDLQTIEAAYDRFTVAQIGEEGRKELAFFLRDEDDQVVGGIKGSYTNYGWLWVDMFWVSDEIRGKGYGSQLITKIEQEALKNGCRNAYLNSFSFQAVEFYKKLGYEVFGELEDFPEGHSVCCLRKSLI
jgi:GNAT superfamily N-acetyltransferase